MLTHWPDFPAINSTHLLDARLYADRRDLLCALPVRSHGLVAEIGVWRAAFSKVLVAELKPRKFLAFDIFTGHTEADWNGMSGHQLFDGLTHRQYYEREVAPFRDLTTIVEGPSQVTLRDYGDRSFDLVYIDGNHHYDAVKIDAKLAADMVADSGFLMFDDYSLFDPTSGEPMGVVPVVNDLVVNQGWSVVGFSLNVEMYCNIALCRPGQAPRYFNAVRDGYAEERDRNARERDRYAEERDRYADERDRHAAERDRYADERDRHAEERDRFAEDRDRHAEERDRFAKERDRHAEERDRFAEERDRYAEERNRFAEERDRCVKERDRCAEERDRLLGERDRLRAELAAIQGSLSWRSTKPLRAIKAKFSSTGPR